MPTAAAPDRRTVCITHVAINDYRHSFAEICHLLGSVGGRLGFRCSVRPRSPTAGDALLDPAASVNVLLGHLPFTADRLLPLVRGRRYVVYQLESLSPGNPLFEHFPAYADLLRGADRVWDYAAGNVARLREMGIDAVDLVPLGHDDSLVMRPPDPATAPAEAAAPPLDVLFYGILTPRRRRIGEALAAAGLTVAFRDKCYGAERDSLIRRAKVVLNIHQFDAIRTLEEARLSYLLANGRFAISETADTDPYGGGVVFADYAELPATVLRWCRAPAAEREAIAERGRRALAARPARAGLAQALAAAVGSDAVVS